MTYSLPITFMTQEQLENIQKGARRAVLLARMGYNHFPKKASVYGPID